VGLLKGNASRIIEFGPAALEKIAARPVERDTPAIRTDAIYVVFTTVDETLAAVRVAGMLGSAMAVPVTLIHFRAVPYPLSVDAPPSRSPVETDEFVARLRAEGFEVHVRVYLCRNQRQGIPLAFKRHSLIVIAGRHSWWPTESERWRRWLEAVEHFVVFVDTSEHVGRRRA
jgi:hypothetical protein